MVVAAGKGMRRKCWRMCGRNTTGKGKRVRSGVCYTTVCELYGKGEANQRTCSARQSKRSASRCAVLCVQQSVVSKFKQTRIMSMKRTKCLLGGPVTNV